MFISGKEIVTIDNKEYIRLADAMQVIAPTATNAARWFQQHQELFAPETFIYSDERFPGKKKRIWLLVPEGFQTFAEACIKAPRLKIIEGVEERIAPFLIEEGRLKNEDCKDNGQNTPLVEEVDIEFASQSVLINAPISYEESRERIYGLTAEPEGVGGRNVLSVSTGLPCKLVNSELSELVVDPPLPLQREGTDKKKSEERVEFLQQTLSNLVASYYVKMCWLKRTQTEAPVEIQSAFTDLTNTLHDTLIENVIADILKYQGNPQSGRCSQGSPTPKAYGLDGQKKAPGALDRVEEYLDRGYEISFETDKEGILCRALSESIGVTAIAASWREALEKAIKQIPSPAPNPLYVSKPNGGVKLVNDMGEVSGLKIED